MRHQKKGKKFGRITGRRRSFMRNLAGDLIRNGKIRTTEARAKAIRPVVERMVTRAKKGDLTSRRLLTARLHDRTAVEKLIHELGPRYAERRGGYLRITKLGRARKRDGASTATIEFV